MHKKLRRAKEKEKAVEAADITKQPELVPRKGEGTRLTTCRLLSSIRRISNTTSRPATSAQMLETTYSNASVPTSRRTGAKPPASSRPTKGMPSTWQRQPPTERPLNGSYWSRHFTRLKAMAKVRDSSQYTQRSPSTPTKTQAWPRLQPSQPKSSRLKQPQPTNWGLMPPAQPHLRTSVVSSSVQQPHGPEHPRASVNSSSV